MLYQMRTTWKVSGMPPLPSSIVPELHGVSVTGVKTYGPAVENGECVIEVDCDETALAALIRAGATQVDMTDEQLQQFDETGQ